MAFMFMGQGVRELQEGNAITVTIIHGFHTGEALGLCPTWQTLLAQLDLLALLGFAMAKTFWPKRSVTLPTMPVDPAGSSAVGWRLDVLQARVATREHELRARQNARVSRRGM